LDVAVIFAAVPVVFAALFGMSDELMALYIPAASSNCVALPVDVIATLFTKDGVIAPNEIVSNGVVPPEEVPDTPLAVVTPMEVTEVLPAGVE
jgi:hypothetical protein